ncbi:hypothetical protein ACJIZ3_024923 [Penstemon smallii]|uniref:HXXXD-type acyl-transferase family protein n=1 Tax=Penstemon smallii TaxID=265156 RepID=A0ABD3TTB7_9LAMI
MSNNGAISRLDLTPWDLQFLLLDPIQKGLLFYEPEFEKSFVDHLKTSLSHTLNFFPPLVGRLGMKRNDDTNTSCYFVDCNNAGALFTHAIAPNVYVRDILDPTHIPKIVPSFFSLNGLLNIQGLSNPLLGVQVTELVDGFFIACTINHCVMDGTSFWHFFNSWSEISRGLDKISKYPVFERSFFNTNNLDKNTPFWVPHMELNLDTKFSSPQLLERVFQFSKENISKLKRRANSEAAGTFENKISSLQAVLAHIWRGVMRCRVVDPGQEVSCVLIIGARSRLPLPDTYFGNAIYFARVVTENGALMQNGLGWVGSELNKTVAKQTREEVIKVMEDSVKNPNILNKGGVLVKNSFLIGSSPLHNVYATDFGWGKPVAVRSGAGQKYDGKMTIFPATEHGGIDVEACLKPETLYALGNDAEFMVAVTL